jgi:carbonic anhydrase
MWQKSSGPTSATKCLGIERVTLTPSERCGAMESRGDKADHATKISDLYSDIASVRNAYRVLQNVRGKHG